MITRLKLKRPPTKKLVVELAIGGWLGKKFRAANWGGTTIPLPFMVVILYWVTPEKPMPNYWVRFHEFIHVRQDEGNACFLVSWVKYLAMLFTGIQDKWFVLRHPRLWYAAYMASYAQHPLELAAYKATDEMMKSGVTPDWLK